jgi:hypothetical protein
MVQKNGVVLVEALEFRLQLMEHGKSGRIAVSAVTNEDSAASHLCDCNRAVLRVKSPDSRGRSANAGWLGEMG